MIGRLGSGAHSHFMFGRRMIHTHDEDGEPILLDSYFRAGTNAAMVERLGVFSRPAPSVGRNRARSRGIGRRGSPRTDNDQPSVVGYWLSADFGLGTVAGMMLITAAIALPLAYSLQHFVRFNRGLVMASGFASVLFGLFLCYQTGFVGGLFSGHPTWIPK